MPAFYGICTTLESQYDIKQIQEYMLPSPPPSRLSRLESKSSSSSVDLKEEPTANPSLKSTSPVEEVHVPIYPNSQFWLSYLVVPHMLQPAHPRRASPDGEAKADKIKYVYFKLILPSSSTTNSAPNTNDDKVINNGTSTTISWGVGAKEGWKGKTMFGLFKSSDDEAAWSGYRGRNRVDKRGFWFSGDGEKEGTFEVQVFRARGRRRESRVFPELQKKREGKRGEAVNLVNTGKLKGHQPQRYYQYALLDAVDEPYVTFRYHLRSMGNLTTMGIFPQPLLNPMTPRFYCPTNDETQHHKSSLRRTRGDDEMSSVSSYANAKEAQRYNHKGEEDEEVEDEYEDGNEEACQLALSDSEHIHESTSSYFEHRHSRSYPLERDEEEVESETEKEKEADEQRPMTNAFRRLSVPPTIRLVSSSSFNEPHSPAKDFNGDKEPVKEPFLRDSSSPSESSCSVNSTGDGECDIAYDLHDQEDVTEVSTAGSETDATEAAADDSSEPKQEVHHTLLKRVRAREGLEVARRNFILRTPSPITHSLTEAGVESSSVEKDEERCDATPPGSGRRIGGSGFLKGVLESALRRRGERVEMKTGENRGDEEECGDERGERKGSGEERGKGERKTSGETKATRGRYEAVRNSL